jgi:hypothetical protein
MRLLFDLDLQKFVIGPGTTQELPSIDAKRSPNAAIEIQFLRGVTPQELPGGATGIFEVKEKGKYDANAIFRAGAWVKTGAGVTTIYTFTLDLMTPAGDSLLGVNAPAAFTADDATDLLSAAASPPVGARIQVESDDTLPDGLPPYTDLFVIEEGHTATDWQVSLTEDGDAIDVTSVGAGTHQFRRVDNDQSPVVLMAAMQYVAGGKTTESQDIVFNYRNDIVRDGDTTPVADPADVILNVRAGKEAIPSGVDSGSVVFDTPFPAGLTYVVSLTGGKPTAGGDQITPVLVEDSLSETGFDYELGADTPDGDYKLNYLAVAI